MLTCITCAKQTDEKGEEGARGSGTPNTKESVKSITAQVLVHLSQFALADSYSVNGHFNSFLPFPSFFFLVCEKYSRFFHGLLCQWLINTNAISTINLNGCPQAIHFVENVLNAQLQIHFQGCFDRFENFFGSNEPQKTLQFFWLIRKLRQKQMLLDHTKLL